ncbi:hypothetical protein [Thermostilla marina]
MNSRPHSNDPADGSRSPSQTAAVPFRPTSPLLISRCESQCPCACVAYRTAEPPHRPAPPAMHFAYSGPRYRD